jgi:hypothetical protein
MTRNLIHKYGATICSYGWDNIAQHPRLLNMMIACPSSDVFIGSIDTIGERKDAHYICNTLVGYIKTIRVNNIVQICTNNLSNMKNAYFQGCVTHCLDLLLEDWGKGTWVKQNVTKVKAIISFIQQHHVSQTIFHHYETNLMLLNPTKTRFATNFFYG